MNDTLAVVTGAWGRYGTYLPEWAGSVAAQSLPPDQAAIVDAGVDDPDDVTDALAILHAAGVDTRTATVHRADADGSYQCMGRVMNTAVGLVDTDWVIRLDADDTLLPWAVADVAQLTADADVVAIGALRDGVEILFPNTSAEWILSGRQGAMAPAAFRRTLWEQAPFIEANDWIESALWIGFAHLGARFVPTERAGFVYRQHDDSHSHTITRLDKARARRQQLALCRRWAPPEEVTPDG